MNMRKDVKIECRRTAESVAAALIYAVSLNLFAVPVGLYSGGLFGLCQVLRTVLIQWLGVSPKMDFASLIYYALNVPILIYAWFKISRSFLLKTLVTLSFMTMFLSAIPIRGLLPDDKLASCVIAGILGGASSGYILRMGSSAGGFDIIGLLLAMHKKDFSVGKVSLLINISLFTVCGFLFEIETVIYSVIFAAILSFTMDKAHSQNIVVEAKIITKTGEGIERDIMERLGRGLTRWDCVGSYTKREGRVLYVLLSKYELPQLRLIVRRHDPNAFIVLSENVHVQGNFLKKLQ